MGNVAGLATDPAGCILEMAGPPCMVVSAAAACMVVTCSQRSGSQNIPGKSFSAVSYARCHPLSQCSRPGSHGGRLAS